MPEAEGELRVFLSWAGEPSKAVALKLRDWLGKVTHGTRFWMSEDISAGSLWDPEIRAQLEASTFGVAVLTQESLASQWLHFEVGALANVASLDHVVPYLIGLHPEDLSVPSRSADREGTLKLVRSINLSSPSPLSDEKVDDLFNAHWSALESAMERALREFPPSAPPPRRDDWEVQAEILQLLRSVARAVLPDPARQLAMKYARRALIAQIRSRGGTIEAPPRVLEQDEFPLGNS
jgi:hypothetical protein